MDATTRGLVATAKKIVLNPSAHNDPSQPFRVEIENAIDAVRELEKCLAS